MSAVLPVVQADRDAVQAFHRVMAERLMLDINDPDRPKLGEDEGDAGTLVQAFARHRLAASAETVPTADSNDGDAQRSSTSRNGVEAARRRDTDVNPDATESKRAAAVERGEVAREEIARLSVTGGLFEHVSGRYGIMWKGSAIDESFSRRPDAIARLSELRADDILSALSRESRV